MIECRFVLNDKPMSVFSIGGLSVPAFSGKATDVLNGNDKRNWFSLYAIDDNIDDDQVICNEIIRGEFRLHLKGPLGLSEGCIAIEHPGDWVRIRSSLKRGGQFSVPGSALKTYGRVTVR